MAIGAAVISGLALFVAFIAWVTSRSKRRWARRLEEGSAD
jgi:hypothetical protein